MTNLLLFQIGPVQAFIAQARRTQDLYVGSRILSMLSAAGIEEALRNDAQMLFPALTDSGEFPASIPHRFAFLSADPNPHGVAERIEAFIRDFWWESHAAKVGNWLYDQVGEGRWAEQFETQAKQWLEIYWISVSTEDYSTHGDAYKAVSALMAARKAARHFPQINDAPEMKCTMTGAVAALPLEWEALSQHLGESRLRTNERLGALALIKRFAGDKEIGCDLGKGVDVSEKPFRSTTRIAGNEHDRDEDEDASKLQYPYLAVLHMDGDRMGELLGNQRGENAHTELSKKLSRFSESVAGLIKFPGELVYAGGDDVLAFLPLSHALETADAIRRKFAEIVGGTISAGIAIMGVKTPLDSALESARLAEHIAKHEYGRDAVVVRDMRSNAIRAAGAKWKYVGRKTEGEISMIEELQNWFRDGKLSGKLGYDMLDISHSMGGPVPQEARVAELRRLINRRSERGTSLSPEESESLLIRLTNLASAHSWAVAPHWVILARFLAKGGTRGN